MAYTRPSTFHLQSILVHARDSAADAVFFSPIILSNYGGSIMCGDCSIRVFDYNS